MPNDVKPYRVTLCPEGERRRRWSAWQMRHLQQCRECTEALRRALETAMHAAGGTR